MSGKNSKQGTNFAQVFKSKGFKVSENIQSTPQLLKLSKPGRNDVKKELKNELDRIKI